MIGEGQIPEQPIAPVTQDMPVETAEVKVEPDAITKTENTIDLLKRDNTITNADFIREDEEIMKGYHLNECNLKSLKELRKCFSFITSLTEQRLTQHSTAQGDRPQAQGSVKFLCYEHCSHNQNQEADEGE